LASSPKRIALAVVWTVAGLAAFTANFVLVFVLWAVVGAELANKKADERVRYWAGRMNASVRIGEPRAEAQRWLISTGGQVDPYPQAGELGITLERIERYSPWYCDGPFIDATVRMDRDGRVASRDVRQGWGPCF
jgi:hypothetical protein